MSRDSKNDRPKRIEVDSSEEPEVFAIKKSDSGIALSRRSFLGGVGGAAVAAVALSRQARADDKKPSCTDIQAHREPITALAFSPDGKYLVSAGEDNKIKVWRLEDGSLIKTIDLKKQTASSLAITPDRNTLIAGCSDNRIRFWRFPRCDSYRYIKTGVEGTTAITVLYDNETLISASTDKIIRMWSVSKRKLLRALPEHAAEIKAIATGQLGNFLCSGDREGTVKLWRLADGECVATKELEHSINGLAMDPKERFICVAIGGRLDRTRCYSLPDLAEDNKRLASGIRGTGCLAISPDSAWLAVGDRRHDLKLSGLGAERESIDIDLSPTLLAFSPDERLLATAKGEQLILWIVPEGQHRGCLYDPKATLKSVEGRKVEVQVMGQTITYTLPCGAPTPPGATCICDCVRVGSWVPTGHTQQFSGTVCQCNLICTCDTVCSCVGHTVSSHYWYPN